MKKLTRQPELYVNFTAGGRLSSIISIPVSKQMTCVRDVTLVTIGSIP
ncbi:MAG: hypothetical protein ACPHF4_00400 [Rubripirellula sp.]